MNFSWILELHFGFVLFSYLFVGWVFMLFRVGFGLDFGLVRLFDCCGCDFDLWFG